MSEKTYTPLISKPKNDFPLVPTARGTEKKMHQSAVRTATFDIEERQHICQMEGWDPKARIPELNQPLRVSVEALANLAEQTEDQPQALRERLTDLIENQRKEHAPVDFLPADEFWMQLAKLLLKGFDGFAEQNKPAPDDLNFKELQRAYNDFF